MALVGVRVEGGLVGPDLLVQIAHGEAPGQNAADFGLAAGARLLDDISRAWNDAKDYWSVFKRRQDRLSQSDPHGTTLTRQQWISRLLDELLGYNLMLLRAGPIINERSYPISHRAGVGETDPPIHVVGFKVDLDHRDPEGGRRLSPQALVQEYINRDEEQLWGIATNGLQLRLLRDTARTTKPTFVEFDLSGILDGDRFNEFAVFYRLCHRSRLPKAGQPPDQCWLERYYQDSIEQGGRVREKLRDGVEEALKILGTGFLRHPVNDALVQRIKKGSLTAPDLYRQLLRLVYRLLFLMVAEERHMIRAGGDAADRRQQIYDTHYGVTRLRERAVAIIERSSYGDLWVSLRQTFAILANGGETNPLGIPPLNGDLFASDAVPDLLGAELYNDALLLAVRRLALFRDGDVLRRVNYGALDVEELGSVYESLLERQPAIVEQDNGLAFDLVAGGGEKKSTGSYYTRPELVHELVKSALAPILEDRIGGVAHLRDREQAILRLAVCDPACGSGHFLLAAARRLGRELAKIRTGEEEPTPADFRRAVRDAIQHCVYGVDLNPLAVDLCKLALWIEGHDSGLPLTFLDHHIKCGNSLVGIFSMDVLADGIPDAAFKEVFGNDKNIVRALKQRNEAERNAAGTQVQLLAGGLADKREELAAAYAELDHLPEGSVTDIHEKERRYNDLRGEGSPWRIEWTAANLWMSAFFLPLTKAEADLVPTTRDLRAFLERHGDDTKVAVANRLSQKLRFFHWPLEFPEIFVRGGFDAVLGNPPWERIKLQEEEFFAVRDRRVAEAPTKAERERLIVALRTNDPELYEEFVRTKHLAETQVWFARVSGRFPLGALGDINLYVLFVELARTLLSGTGRAGLVIPDTIATNATTVPLFSALVDTRSLLSLYGFKNERFLFPGVEHTVTFALLTIGGANSSFDSMDFCWLAWTIDEMKNPTRRVKLIAEDLRLVNPNTKTCPTFRTRRDAELTLAIYRRLPILGRNAASDLWRTTYIAMFHMANDSSLFSVAARSELVPLYEAKMIHHYDHRFGTYEGARDQKRGAELSRPTPEQYANPNFSVKPRYWVPSVEVESRLGDWNNGWLVAFRDIARSTDERSAIFTILPRVGTGHTLTVVLPKIGDPKLVACFVANCNSIVFDYVVRQKLGGTHLSLFILKQLPIVPPSMITRSDIDFIVPRVVKLTYCARDVETFARDVGYDGGPFLWKPRERTILRAELDAYFAHLYGLTRDDVRYILDPKELLGEGFPGETFRVLKEREEREYGEYQTRPLVLDAYDELAETGRFGRVAVTKPADGLS